MREGAPAFACLSLMGTGQETHTEMAQKLISAYIRARPQNKYICYILLRFLSVTDTVSDPSDGSTYFII